MQLRTYGILIVALSLPACTRGAKDAGGSRPRTAAWFVDRTRELGVDFRYESGATGKLYMPEVMGGGLGLFDADGDGDLDLYLLNGNHDLLKGITPGPFGNRLYENRIGRQGQTDGGRDMGGGFVDVTESSGLADGGYGMGLAVGDIDNDGDLDVLVTNFGGARLYLNEGAGQFRDISAAAGIEVPGWSCSASFLDYDRDGLLDLYVTRYVDYDPQVTCRNNDSRVDYCSPKAFEPVPDVLWHNEGEHRFTDVSLKSGITAARAPGLGIVCADLNGDGWIDIFVANDGAANQLWINQRDGTFRDLALQMGVALNMYGRAEAGMGVVVADFDGDENLDLFVTHLTNEGNTLFLNLGGGRGFIDATGSSHLGTSSIPYTGFGVAAFDAELDGDLDILVVNGRVTRGVPRSDSIPAAPWNQFAQPSLFYLNDGHGRFTLESQLAGELGSSVAVSRGMAVGDLDGDGDLDVVVNNIESPARVYLNEAPRAGKWLIVRAIDPRLHRDALGAQVRVEAGGRRFLRPIECSSSYLTSGDPRAHFGLGNVKAVDRLEISWPDGLREVFRPTCVDCTVEIRRGEGQPVK